jgi:D-mannonate dehydratase
MDTALVKIMSVIDDEEVRNKYNINENEYNELCKNFKDTNYNLDRIKLIKRIFYIYNDLDIINSNINIKLKTGNCLYDFYSEQNFNNINENIPYYLDINTEKKNIHFKCSCTSRNTIKNIDLNNKIYIYKIEDVEYYNPTLYIDEDF